MASRKPKHWSKLVDSAIHILKGAVVKVLGLTVTVSVSYNNKSAGRLALALNEGSSEPTAEQLSEIERLANECIANNIEFQCIEMGRAEAEQKFTASPVNGTFIYDKRRPPDSVDPLSLVLLEGWNVNSCAGPHEARTGDVVAIRLNGYNFRPEKATPELELKLVCGPDASSKVTEGIGAEAAGSNKKSAKGGKAKGGGGQASTSSATAPVDSTLLQMSNVNHVAQKVCTAALASAGGGSSLDALSPDQREVLLEEVAGWLATLKNSAYAEGFVAGKCQR